MKRHRFDALSFVSGLLITLLGLAFLLPRTWGDFAHYAGRLSVWFVPVLLLVIGVAVLVPALIPTRTEKVDGPQSDERSTL